MRRPLLPALAALLVPALPSSAAAAGCAYDSMLAGDGVTVHVTVPPKEACSIGTYTVRIARKGTKPQAVSLKRDGTITDVFFEDVTGDGRRDLVVFVSSAGSGAYGRLDIWEWNGDRFRGGIVADLMPGQRDGYRGHDDYRAAGGVLRRRFPVYREGDASCCPSGGTAAFRWDAKTNVWVRE
ncbi:MAG TPA: PliI family lysozyme inhibitor of I-type lysozyme [Thermoanaerobaculia bacterium]|nr:PliI family lysozyme inhibitor of I-type lysozyme [Thermoanaerobaculia bacterium]